MAELATKLNRVSNSFGLETKKISQLKKNHPYVVEDLKRWKTKTGKKAVLATLAPRRGAMVKAWLPDRYGNVMKDKDLKKYKAGSLRIIYKGRDPYNSYILEFLPSEKRRNRISSDDDDDDDDEDDNDDDGEEDDNDDDNDDDDDDDDDDDEEEPDDDLTEWQPPTPKKLKKYSFRS